MAELNAAWNTSVGTWSDLSNRVVTLPATLTPACVANPSGFLTHFAQRYFSVVSASLKRSAPNPLYLGCRFDGENYNIGLVSGTDTPYEELVSAARQLQAEIYTPFAPARLAGSWQTNRVVLSWPFLPAEWGLESAASLEASAGWQPVTNPPVLAGMRKLVELPPQGAPRYFRLRRP